MNLFAVLITGLFAGGLSCAAVQGGLLAGLVTRQRGTASSSVDSQRALSARIGDDLAPVAGFLAGKLVSHTLLGAGLGALGGVVQLSVGVRTVLQIGAGVAICMFGLAQLGVPGFRKMVITPPATWSRLVRGRARASSAAAPAVLGFATVLIPCGVTLSVEALALTSGSAWAGAAVMAVFVMGTVPLFAALGYLARKAATVWRGRLATLTGLVVLTLGLVTVNGGLELAGSPLAASAVWRATGFGAAPNPAQAAQDAASRVSIVDGRQIVVITATEGSYSPSTLDISAGIPTTLVVRSSAAQGCVRAFVIPARSKQWILPVDGDTRIDLGNLKPGRLAYSCGMGMYTGTLSVA